MILIISKQIDFSTDKVIEWLLFYKIPFIRLNHEDKINDISITTSKEETSIFIGTNDISIKLNEIEAIWYRKSGINFLFKDRFRIKKSEFKKIEDFKKNELRIIREFIEDEIKKKPMLGSSIDLKNLNKLKVLNLAKNIGLNIPYTQVISKKSNLKNRDYILKVISEVRALNMDNFAQKNKWRILPYTIKLTDSIKKNLPDNFFPTIFQVNIKKKYEVRVFHLKGKNYSMAIFSQKNKKTETDFRQYDLKNPNRTIPYILPYDIENKINKLMLIIGLDTGSIDLIKGIDNMYYFLEVNPVGQFGMVSTPCNYQLEKKIANEIINISKK